MFDLSSGTFTAPLKGVYEFSFSANSDDDECCIVYVYQNDVKIHGIRSKFCNSNADQNNYANLASTWIVQLDGGDKIRLKVGYGQLYSNSDMYRIFNGKILKLL